MGNTYLAMSDALDEPRQGDNEPEEPVPKVLKGYEPITRLAGLPKLLNYADLPLKMLRRRLGLTFVNV